MLIHRWIKFTSGRDSRLDFLTEGVRIFWSVWLLIHAGPLPCVVLAVYISSYCDEKAFCSTSTVTNERRTCTPARGLTALRRPSPVKIIILFARVGPGPRHMTQYERLGDLVGINLECRSCLVAHPLGQAQFSGTGPLAAITAYWHYDNKPLVRYYQRTLISSGPSTSYMS
jgi:hypothetical protein